MPMLKAVLIVGLGGMTGSIARYLSQNLISQLLPGRFPAGTFTVNILGCLIAGILFGLMERNQWLAPEWRMFLIVGFCGSFTTFSTFSAENYTLLQQGHLFMMLGYILISVVTGLVAVYGGISLGRVV